MQFDTETFMEICQENPHLAKIEKQKNIGYFTQRPKYLLHTSQKYEIFCRSTTMQTETSVAFQWQQSAALFH